MFVLLSAPAAAQELPPPEARPTSGEASLLGARTLGNGEVMIGGAAGWPWIWVQLELAPTPTFNIGLRGAVLYGSPVMALAPGVGGEVAVPMRIHLHGDDDVDLGVFVTPAFALGEAALAGEGGTVFAGDFGYSVRGEAGGLFSVRVMPRFTVSFGVGGHVGLVHTPAAGGVEPVGAAFASAGLEGLISRDTLLFAEVQGGIGIAPSRGGIPLYGETVPPLLRVSLGMAYLL